MKVEELIEAAKEYGKHTYFHDIVHSPVARGVTSAYGIGFVEGGIWMYEKLLNDKLIESDEMTMQMEKEGGEE